MTDITERLRELSKARWDRDAWERETTVRIPPAKEKQVSDCECPYCGEDVEICHDDGQGYAEDQLHQQECPHCEKRFAFTTAIHFTYRPRKADCLNDAPHKYERTNTFPREAARLRCVHCDDEKPLPANSQVQP